MSDFIQKHPPQVTAVREALVNLLMHTDYYSNAKPRIRVLSDRIEFFNPGALPKDIKFILKEEFSMPRNNVIARIFRVIKLSENIGSGFHKMFKGWTSYYSKKPIVEGDFDYYKISFYIEKKATEKYPEKYPENINETQKKIFDLIASNKEITREEIAEKIELSLEAIKKNIKFLKEKGFIKRIGPDKGGHWEVKNAAK